MQHTEQEYEELVNRYNDAVDTSILLRAKAYRLQKAVEWAEQVFRELGRPIRAKQLHRMAKGE